MAFFFASYIFAAWVTELRRDVPTLVFGWEYRIPFLAWTIVPYWSTDLFFVCSSFLFRTRAGLMTHGKRLLAVQLLSVIIYLVFPLKFSFGRPYTDGLFGKMFYLRTSFDTQSNQAPSLHIGFAVVLWLAYGRHLRGWALWITRAWLVLMSLSTLTTYRHHFIDLPTGLWVGLFCVAIIPEGGAGRRLSSQTSSWFRLAALYSAGALLFSAAAWRVGNVSWLILWPAAALPFAVSAYRAGNGSARDGILPQQASEDG